MLTHGTGQGSLSSANFPAELMTAVSRFCAAELNVR